MKGFIAVALALVAARAVAQTTTTTTTPTTSTTLGNQAAAICDSTVGDCVVSRPRTFTRDTLLDIPGRRLVVRRDGSIEVGSADLTIFAAAARLEPGAELRAGSGQIFITTAGDVAIQSDIDGSPAALIDVSGDQMLDTDGGALTITAGGALTVDGKLRARGPGAFAEGGLIDLTAEGNVTISSLGGDPISARSGSGGMGGQIVIASRTGSVTVAREIDASGGDSDGGEVAIDAKGAIAISQTVNVSSESGAGSGGWLSLTTDGDLTLGGRVEGNGQSSADFGGDGGTLDITAGGQLLVNAPIMLMSGGPDGTGGSADWASGGDLRILPSVDDNPQPIKLNGRGEGSCGGDLTLRGGFPAGGGISIDQPIDVSGIDCGGTLDAEAPGPITVRSEINGDAGNAGSSGADIDLRGLAVTITAAGQVHSNGVYGGEITLLGCTLGVEAGGTLSALGEYGANTLRAGGAMRVAGELNAGDSNELRYLTQPPNVSGSTISPAALVRQDATVPACPPPPATTTTSTVTSTSTTVTTTTTSTTAIIATSTTTTVRPTTSTVAPATTTTSTTLPAACVVDDDCPAPADACAVARCADGTCHDEDRTGSDAVTCRLTEMASAIDTRPGGAIKTAGLARTLRKRVTNAARLFGQAGGLAGPKRLAKLRKATAQLSALEKAVRKGQGTKIAADLASQLLALTQGAKARLGALTTGG